MGRDPRSGVEKEGGFGEVGGHTRQKASVRWTDSRARGSFPIANTEKRKKIQPKSTNQRRKDNSNNNNTRAERNVLHGEGIIITRYGNSRRLKNKAVAAAIGSGSLSLSPSLYFPPDVVCDKATKRLHSFFAGWLLLLLLLALWVYV
jgi:hypothetical protein